MKSVNQRRCYTAPMVTVGDSQRPQLSQLQPTNLIFNTLGFHNQIVVEKKYRRKMMRMDGLLGKTSWLKIHELPEKCFYVVVNIIFGNISICNSSSSSSW